MIGKGKFHIYGSKKTISVSSKVANDSAWPFKKDDDLEVKIGVDKSVLIRKPISSKDKRSTKERRLEVE